MENDNELLFVYGSLMNPAERRVLLGRPIDASPARLPGYARGRKRYYFVAKQADAVTDGAILEGLTRAISQSSTNTKKCRLSTPANESKSSPPTPAKSNAGFIYRLVGRQTSS